MVILRYRLPSNEPRRRKVMERQGQETKRTRKREGKNWWVSEWGRGCVAPGEWVSEGEGVCVCEWVSEWFLCTVLYIQFCLHGETNCSIYIPSERNTTVNITNWLSQGGEELCDCGFNSSYLSKKRKKATKNQVWNNNKH